MTSTLVDRLNGVAEGLAQKAPVRAATTANIALSGLQTVDTVVLADGDSVLVKDQTDASENGIYVVSTGNWTRRADFDGARDFVKGTKVYVVEGSTNLQKEFYLTTSAPAIGAPLNFALIGALQNILNDVQTLHDETAVFRDQAAASAAAAAAAIDSFATVASAATVDISVARSISITGTTTISSFGTAATAGATRFLSFAASLTITHNSVSMICPDGKDIKTGAGDTMIVRHEGSGNWRVIMHRAAGDPAKLTAHALPGGEILDTRDGVHWAWSSTQGRYVQRVPKIAFGPSSLNSGTGNISLVNNTWVLLASGVPLDGLGERSGMVAYPQGSRGGIWGMVCVSMPTTSCAVYLRVMQGRTEDNPTNQPNIAIGTKVEVGGGMNSSPGVANVPYQIFFMAPDIQSYTADGHTAELAVEAYAENASSGAGAALSSTGIATPGFITQMLWVRWDGNDG